MGAFMAVLGAGMGAYGKYQAGRAQNAAARYSAKIKGQQARLTEQEMESETTRSHEEARRLKGSQLAAFAKSGAQDSSGTPLLVMAEQAGEMEMDILEQRRNRMIEAEGLRSEAEMLKWQGKQAKRAGTIGAFSTLLGGGAQAGSLMNFGGGKK